ncbi:MAG TPA: chromosome segregation protein SMC [Dehalococcoidia bacterium]|nr:chromosome segregation protein SMC [Dehalococcoidia bacterium]
MYLKRLELQGFKSFAGKTLIEFGPGVTAIVGPNGSGKSNIVDAMRWVLGEQSARTVRAKRTDDLLFAGSSKRPALGLAEVNLILDNSESWLPIDFSEVVITRRAYRSGESDYLLNRNQVRLRDVVDLLLKGNVAQDSYAILGQGAVETALGLRPEERRVLIEEAAGVRHYRARLDESRDRLAATRENLERVQMLIAEIAPRLGHLERQARRAEESARLTRELSEALRAWYGYQWQAVYGALAAARARHDQAAATYHEAQERGAHDERRLSDLRAALEALRSDIAAAEEAHRALTLEAREIDRRGAVASERRSLLTVRREEIEREIAALAEECAEQSSLLAEDVERRQALTEDLARSQAELAERQRALEDFETRWRDARTVAAEAQEHAARAAAAASDLERRIEQMGAERERLAAETARLDERKSDLDIRLADIGDSEARLEDEEERISRDLAEVLRQHDALKRLISEGQPAVAALEERYQESSRALAAAESRYEAIRAAQEEHEGADIAQQKLFSPDTELQGIIGTLTGLLQVPRGMERAIEAGLADSLRAVVVDRPENAYAIVQELQAEGHGNVTIIPLQGLREVSPLNLHKEKGIVGVASRLVRCDSQYRKLVDSLLGRVIVVEDIRIGREVLRRGLGSVVTMDGVLLRPLGSFTLAPTSVGVSPFDRKAQLRELPERIEQLRAELDSVKAELTAKRQAIEANESALAMIARKTDALRTARADKLDEVTAVRGKLAQLRGEMRWIVEAQHQNRERLVALDQAARELTVEREALLSTATETATVSERQGELIAALGQERDALLQDAAEASARVTSLEGELRSIATLRAKQEATVARLEEQLSGKREQLVRLTEELATMESEVEAAAEREATLREQVGATGHAVEEMQARRSGLEEEMSRARESYARAREALVQAERDQREAAAEVERREAEVAALRDTLRDEGIELPELEADMVAAAAGGQEAVPEYLVRKEESRPPVAGAAQVEDPAKLKAHIGELRAAIRALGPVNAEAVADYEEGRERHDFLTGQVRDLQESEASLRSAIGELEDIIRTQFKETYEQVGEAFSSYFTAFFGGGKAELVLTPPEDHAASGIDIVVEPPGKKLQSMALLSGGERSLTALALLFALLKVRAVPFVVLDEVDAALDEGNVDRFAQALTDLTSHTQFIVVTHNRRTIEAADAIYGVTMGGDGVSRVLSLRLADLPANLT